MRPGFCVNPPEIPKTRFMDFGLFFENEKGEYVVLNDVRTADIRLPSLVYFFVHVSTYCVPIALLRQNKSLPLLYLGHAQIERSSLPLFLKNWLNFRVRGQFEIKILIMRGHSDINRTYFI